MTCLTHTSPQLRPLLTPAHRDAIARLLQTPDATLDIRDILTQFDPQQPYAEQTRALIDSIGPTPQQWQTEPLLVNLPRLNYIAAGLLAELHGRMGYFPAIVRMRPVANTTPPQFEVAEILNLQEIRDAARTIRRAQSASQVKES